MPYTLPGGLHPSNKNCIDWNYKGVIAYASHNIIIIVDSFTCKRVQAIDLHSAAVNIVCWSPPCSVIEHARSDDYRIASSDISGQIIISEPLSAAKRNNFSYASSTVLSMKWFIWKDMSQDFLLSLHSGNSLVLWNTDSGDKMWIFTYSLPLFDMSLDPFNSRNVAFSSSGGSLVLSNDLSLSGAPSSSGRVISLTENFSKSVSSIQMMTFHNAYRNTLFVVVNGQLYCINSDLHATLFSMTLEPNVISLLPCTTRDALFSVYANGTVILHTGFFSANDRVDAQFGMEKVALSETLRHGAQQRAVCAMLCPVTQSTVVVLYNSGRMAFWQLTSNKQSSLEYRSTYVDDYLSFSKSLTTSVIGTLSLQQSGFIGALASGLSCVRMRPMDELSSEINDQFAHSAFGSAHIAAISSNAGVVHLVDVFTSNVLKEFSIQNSPIKCLEWGGAYTLVTAGYNHALSTIQLVRNDVFATDIRTGTCRRIRPETDESPVSMLSVSFYHCYLALAFQREPLEIWDLKGLRLLRRMSRACPLITDMAWSCKHHAIKTTEGSGQSVYRENLVVLDSDNRLYHVVVKGLHVKDGKEVNAQWKSGGWSIRTMAWKDDILAMGDVDGRIAIWDLGRRQSRHVRASRFSVIRMCFSRLAGDHTLAVLNQRELSLWDIEAMCRMQQMIIDHSRAALDMDLCGVSPILITNDNVFCYAPTTNRNSPLPEKDIPVLMNSKHVSNMINDFHIGKSENALLRSIIGKKVAVSPDKDNKVDISGIENESLLRRFLGDKTLFALLDISCATLHNNNQLSPDLQMFWPCDTFRERELRVTCGTCSSSDVEEKRLVERAVIAGGKAKDRLIDRLIGSSDLKYSSIKAALLVSNQESEKARSLIKLIATNLIASDMVEDGVELLFLVGAGADACRYLQSQQQWNKSIVYAKMGLQDPDDVLSKWISHLSLDQKTKYMFAQASRGAWPELVEALSSVGLAELARLILRTTTGSLSASIHSSSTTEGNESIV